MRDRFKDRREAGRLLAKKLENYAAQPLVVIGLARGGVPVASEVARRLRAPLGVMVARKLGVPSHEELAMGAIAPGGARVLNREVLEALRITETLIGEVERRERVEMERRQRAYRDGRPDVDPRGRLAVVVDDGIATGATMLAAVEAIRGRGAAKVVVAAPVIARSTRDQMRPQVDDLVAVIIAEELGGVGRWYDDFTQTTDEEARESLRLGREEQERLQADPAGIIGEGHSLGV